MLLTAVAKCGGPWRADAQAIRQTRGRYHYYRCRKSDSGATVCAGVAIAMAELDDAVLSAIEETALEPKRLQKMAHALVARAAERNQSLAERQKTLDGERRKAKKQIAELYARVGAGDIAMDQTLKDFIASLQQRIETLTRQAAHIAAERSRPIELLRPERAEEFGMAVKAALRNPENRAFARAYVNTLVSEVTVSDDEIRIKGPKAALIEQAAIYSAKGELVPSFAQQWRTMSDKNANWRLSLSY
ncbi:MAG: zinc ribbon domain-containing protein [Parvularculaceae bacterium]